MKRNVREHIVRIPSLNGRVTVLQSVSALLIGVLGTIVSSSDGLPLWLRRYQRAAFPVFGFLAIGSLALFLRNVWLTWPQTNPLREKLDAMRIHADVIDDLTTLANTHGSRRWLSRYLVEQVSPGPNRRKDPTERYWSYIALAKLDNSEARRGIKLGLKDDNDFARSGAQEAETQLKKGRQR
jgi:hypothetical protein